VVALTQVAPNRPAGRDVRLTERDVRVLSFMAEHRLVLETHIQKLLGSSADATRTRLRTLARGGYVTYRRVFAGEPALCQIRRPGLAAIASRLPPPRLKLACYAHDVGAAWLYLAARNGTFGPMCDVISERELRSHDGRSDRDTEPYGVRLGGVGQDGGERLHYPDLLLVTPEGRRIAVELELSSKGPRHREGILAAYGADARIDAVLYLVDNPSLARAIERSAERVGVDDRVHVQYFRWAGRAPGAERAHAAERGQTRSPVVSPAVDVSR
jgi:hypothetical protein